MSTKTPQKAGERLSEAILSDLPANLELDPREKLLLDAAAEQADAIEALEEDIRDRGYLVPGAKGGTVVNPSVRESRQGRLTLSRLLAGLDIPDSANLVQLRGRRAAEARWERQAS